MSNKYPGIVVRSSPLEVNHVRVGQRQHVRHEVVLHAGVHLNNVAAFTTDIYIVDLAACCQVGFHLDRVHFRSVR